MTWKLKRSTTGANTEPNSKKDVAWPTRTSSVQQRGPPSKKATLAKSLLSTVDTLILLLLQFIASSMRRTVPKIAVKFAIPIESNYSGLCWLNLFCAELRENDPVWPAGAIVWIRSHCTMTLWAYIDYSRVDWDLSIHFCWNDKRSLRRPTMLGLQRHPISWYTCMYISMYINLVVSTTLLPWGPLWGGNSVCNQRCCNL